MNELHGGTILDTPEKMAQAMAHGPEHVLVCAWCQRQFYSRLLKTDVCWGCWYEGEVKQAANMFSPLSDELERRLEVRTSVDQTGGMVMCLRVPIGRQDDEENAAYAYFGQYPSEDVGLGLYRSWEDEGEYHSWPGEFECHAGTCGWYHHPDLCKDVAEWAAPIIVDFATREVIT